MSVWKKCLYFICVAAALGYTALVLWEEYRPATKRCFTSSHAFGDLPPLMCFAQDSIFNVGSAEELDRLPNIGVVLSNRIVDYREIWGDYRLPEDLLMVKGIGEKTVAKLMETLEEELVPKFPGE